jgi:hypothetical protein
MNIHVDLGQMPRAPRVKTRKPSSPADRKRLKLMARIRKEAEAEIERLLIIIDEIDGDPDLEPYLGVPERHPSVMNWAQYSRVGSQENWAIGLGDDREAVCEDEGAQCEDEGSDVDRELDPAEMGIADDGGAQEFSGEYAACNAFREDRERRLAGRELGEKVAASVAPIPFDEAIPQIDGTWLLKHHGEMHRLMKLPAGQMGTEVGSAAATA